MPAYFENGVFTDANPAWHGMGVVVEDETLTAERIYELVPELASKVTQSPIFAPYAGGEEIAETEKWLANVRELDGRILGVMSSKYELLQTSEMFDFGDALVAQAEGSHWKTAGTLKDGSLTWGLLELPNEIKIGGLASEAMRPYVMVTNSFDGSCAFQALTCWTRVVCANTWNIAIGESMGRHFKLRHTSGLTERLVDAQEALRFTFDLGEQLQVIGDTLIAEKLGKRELNEFLKRLVPFDLESSKIVRDNAIATREDIAHIFQDSPTTGDAAGTKWGALQAVMEYTQRYQTPGQSGESRISKVMLAAPALNTRAQRILIEA